MFPIQDDCQDYFPRNQYSEVVALPGARIVGHPCHLMPHDLRRVTEVGLPHLQAGENKTDPRLRSQVKKINVHVAGVEGLRGIIKRGGQDRSPGGENGIQTMCGLVLSKYL